jgi:hypothetical protein
MDAPVTPAGVLTCQAQDEGLDRAAGSWAAGTLASGDGGVTAAREVAVPAQDRVRGDDQMQLPQPGAGESVQQSGEQSAVYRGEAWLAGRNSTNDHLGVPVRWSSAVLEDLQVTGHG